MIKNTLHPGIMAQGFKHSSYSIWEAKAGRHLPGLHKEPQDSQDLRILKLANNQNFALLRQRCGSLVKST